MKKFLSIFVPVIILIGLICMMNVSYAAYNYDPDTAASWANNTTGTVVTATQNTMGAIITVIRMIGTGIAIIMLTYIGIKYMTASPDGKAEIKKSAVQYVVGAVVLFATTNLLGIISNFATNSVK